MRLLPDAFVRLAPDVDRKILRLIELTGVGNIDRMLRTALYVLEMVVTVLSRGGSVMLIHADGRREKLELDLSEERD